MIQLYPISLFLLMFSSLISFLEVYKAELSFLLRIKQSIRRSRKIRNVLALSSLAAALLMLLFPLYPGPRILGDLFPSLSLIYASLQFRAMKEEKDDVVAVIEREAFRNPYFKKGVLFALCFILHLIFPSFIII